MHIRMDYIVILFRQTNVRMKSFEMWNSYAAISLILLLILMLYICLYLQFLQRKRAVNNKFVEGEWVLLNRVFAVQFTVFLDSHNISHWMQSFAMNTHCIRKIGSRKFCKIDCINFKHLHDIWNETKYQITFSWMQFPSSLLKPVSVVACWIHSWISFKRP